MVADKHRVRLFFRLNGRADSEPRLLLSVRESFCVVHAPFFNFFWGRWFSCGRAPGLGQENGARKGKEEGKKHRRQ